MLAVRRVFLSHHHLHPRLRPGKTGTLAGQLRRMADQIQAGQVRTVPDSEVEVPEGKKARLDVQEDVIMASAAVSPPSTTSAAQQKLKPEPKKSKRKSKHKKPDLPEPCSPEDVLWHEIKSVLGSDAVEKAIEEGVEYDSPFAFHQEIEVLVKSLSPGGELFGVH